MTFRQYILNILIGIDQLFNAILLGSVDHTISGRVGYNALLKKQWAIVLEKIINFIFFFDENHCYKSIEWDRVPLNKEDIEQPV